MLLLSVKCSIKHWHRFRFQRFVCFKADEFDSTSAALFMIAYAMGSMIEGRAENGPLMWQCLEKTTGLEKHTRLVVLHWVSADNQQFLRADEYFWHSVHIAPGGIPMPVQCSGCGRVNTLNTAISSSE